MGEPLFPSPDAPLNLARYPKRRGEQRLAWNSADKLLLNYVSDRFPKTACILVVNDDYGALCTSVKPQAAWTDSALARLAISANLLENGLEPPRFIDSTAQPTGFDAVVIKIPKLMALFEYQLAVLASTLAAGTPLVAGGMDKHLSPRAAQLMEQYFGPTERHRGRQKARIFSTKLADRDAPDIPADASYFCEILNATVMTGPNVFSQQGLDIGSRFLLDNIDELSPASTVIDLACGNGVLGLHCAQTLGSQRVAFCDESSMAIKAAKANAQSILPAALETFFHHGDGMLGYQGPQGDIIVCNPPFHTLHQVDDYVGRRLLQQCARHLLPGGRLCVVANRHLPYLPTLKKDFAKVDKLAQNDKFIVWLALK